ncbi:U3 small nucleolar RNA-associated protein 20 [Marchantia polymorpha subsp. ruderalis]|uniref:Uncharacterized protein n=2 Tax=Marchantia polymorpha TaxID=3197 RepID=A0AAF6BAE5_MARPO|nr:hypothetical protein MARPO_0054s0075 [Marchantia polymorpha]BBN08979.1 hypothetical protein Mp_4g16100 [Marchantia polymorpha subsp. ruderalis]|eukprot:PTQ37966.1 hypothetical protein MARPO_0054s0075 [Marchantia polymorpha]
MAPSRAIKSLNKGPGPKRFVFKNFSQRVEEVDVDVFRSLTPVKFEPSSGSSFFHENLVRWRELNCAAEFNDVYHELLPLVQTLPQLLLHKDLIMNSLLSRVRLSAMLSLEPILSLIALLSRDLQGEFIPYLAKFFDTCAELLKTGGDQEPELLEQVFVSISYIIKYLVKYLTKDTLLVLRVTKSLRFYHRSYVQDFVAESVSFLLRKAPPKQLIKGVRRLFIEVETDRCESKISSCCSLLYNTLRGPSSGLHSQAESFLQLLLDRSILSGGRKRYNEETGEVAVDIVARTFLMLCEDVKRDKIELLWECLLGNISQELAVSRNEGAPKMESGGEKAFVLPERSESNGVSHSTQRAVDSSGKTKSSMEESLKEQHGTALKPEDIEAEAIPSLQKDDGNTDYSQIHLVHLLKLLNTVLEYAKGSRVNDYGPLFSFVPDLLRPEAILSEPLDSVQCLAGPVAPTKLFRDPTANYVSEVLRFLLALAKSHGQVAGASGGPGVIVRVAPKWILAFECKRVNCLFPFLRGLIQLDVMLLQTFAPYVLRTLDRLVEEYPADVLLLLLDLSQRLDLKSYLGPESARLKIFVINLIQEAITALKLKHSTAEQSDGDESPAIDPAMVWVALQCLPWIIGSGEEHRSLAWEYVTAVDNFLVSDADTSEDSDITNKVWEFLLATALCAHLRIVSSGDSRVLSHHATQYLELAVKYKKSSDVLTAVADLLEASNIEQAPEYKRTDMSVLLGDFASNLCDSHKDLRIATLRILAFHEPFGSPGSETDQAPAKRRKRLDGQRNEMDPSSSSQIFRQLLTVESTSLSVENCRKSTLVISAIKVEACSGRMPTFYILPVAKALSGLLYNRFASLWDPVIETLAGMLEAHGITVLEYILHLLETTQNILLYKNTSEAKGSTVEETEMSSVDVWSRFDSCMLKKEEITHTGTLLNLQLKTLQKVPKIAESRSRQLVPMFLAFVGHDQSAEERRESNVGKGSDWKPALKEWLNLIREMKNARAFYSGLALKEILLNRFLGDSDPTIQEVTLDCLLNWKDNYLTSYESHLKNIVSSKAIREELTTWNVGKESHEIKDEDRQPLLTVVLMLLFPRIMRRTVKSLGKSGVGVQRNAVLSFLARLEPNELAPLFCQLIKPLQSALSSDKSVANASNSSWIIMLEEGADSHFIEQVNTSAVAKPPHKRKLGFLHMVLSSLDIFNVEQLRPYIHALLAIVLRLMEACALDTRAEENSAHGLKMNVETESLGAEGLNHNSGQVDSEHDIEMSNDDPHVFLDKDSEMIDQDGDRVVKDAEEEQGDDALDIAEVVTAKGKSGVREIKSLCLKVIASVVKKCENIVFNSVYWDIFFSAIRQSVDRFVDENSSSTSPGALMQCFILMSQRMDLAPLLSKNPMLVPNLLSVLSVRGASSPVISAVLSFVENILDLLKTGFEDHRVEAVRGILTPHLSILLSTFRDCLTFHRESTSERRLLKRELKILTRLSTFIVDPDVAAKLLGVLLPMLKVKKKMDQGLCLDVLHLLEGIGPTLEVNASKKCLPVLSPLLVTVSNRGIRVAVAQTLRALANVDHSLLIVAELLVDLNSMSPTDIDEYDYTRRLAAYDRISKSFFSQITRLQALLVLSSVIFDMGSEDMSIRHRASDCLQEFVRFAASLSEEVTEEEPREFLEKDDLQIEAPTEENDAGVIEIAQQETLAAGLSSKSLKSLVPTFLLVHVRNAMSSEILVVRREWVLLLREMVLNFPDVPALKEYEGLINKDVEADFFFNIVHLQVHRRMRAMAKFRTLCTGSRFSQGALSRIFVPLFMNSLFEARGDKEGNLVSVAVETLATIGSQLPWEPYLALLMRCFRLIGSKPEHQKTYVRVACAILDTFHFFLPSSKDDEDSRPEPKGSEGHEVVPFSGSDFRELTSGKTSVHLAPEVLKALRGRILPEVRRLMVLKGDIVSTPVALTQVKILKLMPQDVIEVELPQVVRTIINLLKIRSQAIRDEARAALVAITETLGAHYLRFIVEVLQDSLVKGFEVHVLGYTLNSILVKLLPTVQIGAIDYCLDQLLDVLENDIMGEVAEEKNVEAIAGKMKETKAMRSYESLKLLAEVVNFQTHATALLGPVRRNLHKSLSPKVKPKIESMLNHLCLGFLHNKSMSQTDLLVIVHAIIEDGVKEEKAVAHAAAVKKQMKADASSGITSVSKDPLQAAKAPLPNYYLITEFALKLLNSHLKRVKINFQDTHTLGMLNPWVLLLQECLNSKYDEVLASSLKSLSFLLLLPLPAIDNQGSGISALIFSICQRFSKTENPLLVACVNVLIILIRHCKTLRLSDEQLKTLLQLPIFVDMEGGSRMALSLLKAIVGRKLLVPELYDMMNRVAQLMVTSHLGPVRQLCSQILLQFLLDYPLGQKRLQQHLDFFITNVGYVETSGREAALEMLHTIILKFPDAVVEEQADSMFFPLVTRLVNDDSNQVRSMIGTILKVLMGRVGPRNVQRFVLFALSWYKGADQRLWRPAAQVLGFMIEVVGTTFEQHSQVIFPQCTKILSLALSSLDTKASEADESGKAQFWQEAYFSLTMMEKFFQKFPKMIFKPECKEIWELVCPLLLHQHLWVRKVCGRLLETYFAACGELTSQDIRSAALYQSDVSFLHPSWLLLLVGSFCQQLDSGAIDDAMGESLVRILVALSSLLPLLPPDVSKPSKGTSAEGELRFLGCGEKESEDRVARALILLGWGTKNVIGTNLTNGGLENSVKSSNGQTVEDGVANKALSMVFRKLQKIALRVHNLQTKVIFRWYAAMAAKLDVAEVERYLPSMLVPLYKLTEGSASKVVPEDVKSLGSEVLNQLREVVGTGKFVNVYNSVRESVKENRDKRKTAQKISVLVDPERNAKRKIKMSAKRQAQKKRKVIHAKRLMGL